MQLFKQARYGMLVIAAGLATASCNNDDSPAPVVTIASVNPTSGPVGSDITITGTEFGSDTTGVRVTFTGGALAKVKTIAPTSIVATVPAGAQDGPITVKIGSKSAVTSPSAFTLGNKTVIEVSNEIAASTTWEASKVYVIKGFVYVRSGATLTIQPGTIIKGGLPAQDPSGQQRGGTLIVQPGAKLMAIGTASQPIVFTSSKAAGSRNYGDWGGVVLIGKAPINRPGATNFEGGISGTTGTYSDAADNSGTLKYVRIEFGGIALSNRDNSEINGLTMYGVGNGTTIENVQVSYSGDDSFEWFGGTVNAKYLVAFRGFDDDWDTDWGYSGKVQFALSLRDPNVADQSTSNGFESDNFDPGTPANGANDGLPLTGAVFANVSNFVFQGAPSSATTSNGSGAFGRGMHLRRNTSISVFNSLLVGYPEGLRLDGTTTLANATSNGMQLRGIVLANMTTPVNGAGGVTADQATAFFNTTEYANQIVTLASLGTLGLNANNFNLASPAFTVGSSSPLLSGAVWTGKGADSFFQKVNYRGAFNATDNWTAGWTNFNPQNTNYDK
ncbi:IPT/TIG domain-containing protein [Siphonobacter curvatus]|uniref:Cell shape-determining protein MreB n=1 Tax=Siphonobacter curvatus TaxID=2094562 RepID=A0A2S7IL00_9BACT|nr:IPT/TIG domain-containing protein [Siphonobacter curvatus]PQA58355.1 cell shape-determining protein MreB [Siphonobacter curvatus]